MSFLAGSWSHAEPAGGDKSGRAQLRVRAPCTLAPGPLRTVVRIVDAETLTLDDGAEVRLIGALAPRAADAGAAAGQWPPENEAREFLSSLTLGRRVRLAYDRRRADRYGRRLSHVFLADRGATDWVQGAMLEAGMARAYGLPENFACAHELDAHERAARKARRGLWSNYIYSAKSAQRTALLMRLRFRYARVEGVVASVTATRSAVFVNFGADWKKDFTARAGAAATKAHPDFRARLESLNGQRVAIRGWIDRNNGPMIDLDDPSQIEAVSEAGDPPAPQAPPNAVAPSSSDDAPKENRPDSSATNPGGVEL
ncbi:MAG: thermonuclease family protein [Hyphomicrobium sp.]